MASLNIHLVGGIFEMKKLLCLLLVATIACVGLYPHNSVAAQSKKEVVVFNWSDYISDEVLNDFTKETGINVIYSTYESNESMLAKLQITGNEQTGYDIVVPSTYYIGMLREKGLIQELNLKKIGNIKYLDKGFLDQDFDKGNRYSIPYMWGALGIVVNTKHVKTPVEAWADLANPAFAGKLIFTDDVRDLFGAALKAVGLSPNTRSEADLKKASDWLMRLKPMARVFSSEIKQPFMGEEVHVGMGWSGDTLWMQDEKPELRFIWPREGAIIWVDSFVIPRNARNVENAHIFINYMLRPEVAAKCAEEYRYSTPNVGALSLLPKELSENRVFRPRGADLAGSETLLDVGAAMQLYSKYWEKLLD